MDKTCPCGKTFFVKTYLLHRKKYCCKVCFYKYHGRRSGLKYKLVKENPTSFKKGQKPWNDGLAGKGICKPTSGSIKKGERRSIKTEFTRENTVGSKNAKWKGQDVCYSASHAWIIRKYGKASRCENRDNCILGFPCKGISQTFDWAFINKKGFKRDRKSYMELCHSCHIIYDRQ